MELPNTLRIKKIAENKATAKRYNDLNDLFKVHYIEELDSYLVVNEGKNSWVIPVFKDLAKELDAIDKRERGRLRKKAYDFSKERAKLPKSIQVKK